MLYTSATAAKLLRRLNDDLQRMEMQEENSKCFHAALQEDPESVRPDYDYSATLKEMTMIEQKIRKVKHTINVFNATTVIPEFGMTIDEMLVYLPQLTRRCARLDVMQNTLPKTRVSATDGIIDYRYANYDIEQVRKDLQELSDTLARAQTALDLVNNTVEFEIDI